VGAGGASPAMSAVVAHDVGSRRKLWRFVVGSALCSGVRRAKVVRRRRQVARMACCAVLMVAGAHGVSRGATDPDLARDGAGACPVHEEVLAALRKLGTSDDPARVATAAVEAGLAITDAGAQFRVSVGGHTRDYDDV